MNSLVICIGNLARGDDGVARHVGTALEPLLPESMELLSTPQLDIVMAEDVARASLVVFVDAERREAPDVRVDTVEPSTISSNAHALSPEGLLALAQTLYGATPETRLVSISAPEMDHGEGLSDIAQAASLEATRTVQSLLGLPRD